MSAMQGLSRRSRPAGAALLVAAVALPAVASNYIVDVGLTIATYSILGLGLNIVVGYAGLLESFGAGYVSSRWTDVLVFGVLIAVLVIKPTGLFGERVVERM